MRKNYDISKLESYLMRLKDSPSIIYLNNIKTELNKLFDEAECLDVIYTKNTDKLLFGICVMPYIDNDTVGTILVSDEKVKINKYYIEFDSKLFDKDLTDKEMTALVLHEIGHLVTNDIPIKQLRRAIDDYFLNNDSQLSLKDTAQYKQILSFGMKDTLIKITSIFFRDEEVVSDAFVSMCGYGEYLESALNKITENVYGMTKGVKAPKLAILNWCFRLYSNVKMKRIPALHLLNKSKSYTGSTLEKREIDNVIRALNRIDTDIIEESTLFLEEVKKKNSIFSQLKLNGLKSIENDYYEFAIRMKNSDTEDEVMYTIRQINLRLSILADYIENDDLTESDKTRWMNLYQKYADLREKALSKKIYNKKNYGLFFDYNQLDKPDDDKDIYF